MNINKKFLQNIVKFLFEQAYNNVKNSDLDVDKKYFEGKRNAFEQIMLLMDGDNDELYYILEQMRFKESLNVELEMPF